MIPRRCLAFLVILTAGVAGTQSVSSPGDFARAFVAAEHGEPQAALAVADAYRLGQGTTADYLAAEGWYVRAAQAGIVRAATELGLLYIDRRQPMAALPWLEHAARRGDPRAIGALATLYVNGGGIAPDRPLAYGLTARSAATGLAAAKAQLTLLQPYLTPADIDAAAERLRRWDDATPTPLPVGPVTTIPLPVAPACQVQIGAYRSTEGALHGWEVLSARLKLAADIDPLLIPAGPVIRLRLPAPDRDAAYALCRTINARGLRCVAFRADGEAPGATSSPVFGPS